MGQKEPSLPIYMMSSLLRNKGTPTPRGKSPSWPPKKPDCQPPTDFNETQLQWIAPQPLPNDSQCYFPKTHALSAKAPNTLSSTAPLTNVGNVIRQPLDTIKIDAQNTPRTSLMSSRIVMTTTITYLLMQITIYPVNAESPTNQWQITLCPILFLYWPLFQTLPHQIMSSLTVSATYSSTFSFQPIRNHP